MSASADSAPTPNDALELEDDSAYISIGLKGARVHRTAVVTDPKLTSFDFKSTIEARVIVQSIGGGRITVGASAVIMPDCVLRSGPEGLVIGRGAFIGPGVLCEARHVGDGAIIEQGCILVCPAVAGQVRLHEVYDSVLAL